MSVSTCRRVTSLCVDPGEVDTDVAKRYRRSKDVSFLHALSTPPLSPLKSVLSLECVLLQVDTDVTRHMSLLPILLYCTSLLECVLLQVDTDITRFFPFSTAINRILRWLPQALQP